MGAHYFFPCLVCSIRLSREFQTLSRFTAVLHLPKIHFFFPVFCLVFTKVKGWQAPWRSHAELRRRRIIYFSTVFLFLFCVIFIFYQELLPLSQFYCKTALVPNIYMHLFSFLCYFLLWSQDTRWSQDYRTPLVFSSGFLCYFIWYFSWLFFSTPLLTDNCQGRVFATGLHSCRIYIHTYTCPFWLVCSGPWSREYRLRHDPLQEGLRWCQIFIFCLFHFKNIYVVAILCWKNSIGAKYLWFVYFISKTFTFSRSSAGRTWVARTPLAPNIYVLYISFRKYLRC